MTELTEEQEKVLQNFYDNLLNSQVDLDPEILKLIDDNFWDLAYDPDEE